MCRCQNLQKISSDFISIYEENCWQPGLCPGPHCNCCLSLYLNIVPFIRQGPGKVFLGFWKVLEIFVTKRVGTLVEAGHASHWVGWVMMANYCLFRRPPQMHVQRNTSEWEIT